jgi:signal transduction histidine kinase
MQQAQLLQDEIILADCFLGLGNIANATGNLQVAINHYLQALKTFEKNNDIDGLNNTYIALAELYSKQNNLNKAIEFNIKAVNLLQDNKQKIRQVSLIENIAKLYFKQNQLPESRQYYFKALEMFKEMNNKAGESISLKNIGEVYYEMNKYDSALVYFQKSLKLARSFDAKPLIASNLINIGSCYYKMKLFDLSEKSYLEVIKLASENNLSIELEKAYDGISLVYSAINKQQTTQRFNNINSSIKDSLYNDSTFKKIADLQLQFEVQAKKNQLELLEKDKTINELELLRERQIKLYLQAIIALLFVLIIGTIYFNILNSRKNQILKRQNEELKQLNNVKDRFFTIISHDLRNNLATMRLYFDIIGKGSNTTDQSLITRQISESVENTIDLLENLLVWASNEIKGIPLKIEKLDLYQMIEDNINMLMANASNKEIILINELDFDTFALGDKNTVNLVIRNLLNNAIKFTPFGGEVIVKHKIKNNYIEIEVCDNGIGISKEKQANLFTQYATSSTKGTANEKGTGLGLMLCKEFIEKNNGKIWVRSNEKKGTCFTFTLPVA